MTKNVISKKLVHCIFIFWVNQNMTVKMMGTPGKMVPFQEILK